MIRLNGDGVYYYIGATVNGGLGVSVCPTDDSGDIGDKITAEFEISKEDVLKWIEDKSREAD